MAKVGVLDTLHDLGVVVVVTRPTRALVVMGALEGVVPATQKEFQREAEEARGWISSKRISDFSHVFCRAI